MDKKLTPAPTLEEEANTVIGRILPPRKIEARTLIFKSNALAVLNSRRELLGARAFPRS